MPKQKQKKRKNSISQPEEPLLSTENLRNGKKLTLSLREIKQNYSTLPANPENNLHYSKSDILNKLHSHLQRKLALQISINKAVEQEEEHKISRLKKIKAEIEGINEENSEKIKKLAKIQADLLKKIEKEMKIDREIEQKLMIDYQEIVKNSNQISLTRSVKKITDKEDWVFLEKEQKKIDILTRQFLKRQLLLDKSNAHALKKKREAESSPDQLKGKPKPQKKERKKKSTEEVKEIGRQFLQYAKKAQFQLKQNFNLMDINKKSIDYLPEIKTILKNQGEDLSKPFDLNQSATKLRKRKNSPLKNNK